MPAYGRSGYWTPHIGAARGYVNRPASNATGSPACVRRAAPKGVDSRVQEHYMNKSADAAAGPDAKKDGI